MVADPVFLDTNVLIYMVRPESPYHGAAVEKLRTFDRNGRPAWISSQVLREYMAAATRPQGPVPGVGIAEALRDVNRFQEMFEVTQDNSPIFDRLIELVQLVPVAGKQVHDANLVASMLENGIRHLLTFNQRDFRRFAGQIVLEAI